MCEALPLTKNAAGMVGVPAASGCGAEVAQGGSACAKCHAADQSRQPHPQSMAQSLHACTRLHLISVWSAAVNVGDMIRQGRMIGARVTPGHGSAREWCLVCFPLGRHASLSLLNPERSSVGGLRLGASSLDASWDPASWVNDSQPGRSGPSQSPVQATVLRILKEKSRWLVNRQA